MNIVIRRAYSFKNTSMRSPSMLIALTCSLLVHVTGFAFSHHWQMFPVALPARPLLVELIDTPLPVEKESSVKAEDAHTIAENKGSGVTHTQAAETIAAPNTSSLLALRGTPEVPLAGVNEPTASASSSEATVSLDSRDLKYVSYLSTIKQKIEPQWHYPESAQQIGLQGKLALRFSIVQDGQMNQLELLSSSGHPLLDEEALNAVRGAAPYSPLPERLHLSCLHILATFEYKISPFSMSRFSPAEHEEGM